MHCSGPNCSRPVAARGLCDSHYRQAKADKPLTPIVLSTRAKSASLEVIGHVLWAQLEERPGPLASPCWEYTGRRDPHGYGRLRFRNKTRAHQIALMVAGVSLGDGASALHHCDNPPCCNPEHLYAGSMADNVRDMFLRGRAVVGEASFWAHYSDSTIEAIRWCRDMGKSLKFCVQLFGVSQSQASRIGRRETRIH